MKAWIEAEFMKGTKKGLQAIDGYKEGPVHTINTDVLTPEIGNELMDEFKKLYPNESRWRFIDVNSDL